MNTETLPSVLILEQIVRALAPCKFVQIQGPDGRTYIRGNDGNHETIFECRFQEELKEQGISPEGFSCVGGGV